jgi:hypothetical protein
MSLSFASGTVPLPSDTLQTLEAKILLALNGGGGAGGGGIGEVLTYSTTDPTTDGVVPTDPTQGAIAYKDDGNGSMFTWNIATQAWV